MSEFKEYIKKEPRKAQFKNQTVATGFKQSETDPLVWEPIPEQIDSLNRILNKIANGTLSQHASPQVFKRDTGKDVSWTTIRKLAIDFGIVTVKAMPHKRKHLKDRLDIKEMQTKQRISAAKTTLKKLEARARSIGIIKNAADPNKPKVVTEEQIARTTVEVKQILDDTTDVIFKANPGPQSDFLAASEREVFYGGARGGGKSYSLIIDPLRHCDKGAHRALILRRTMPELRDLINHSQKLYKRAFPGASWREQEKEWRFPSGARIEFGYAESSADALRYQGQSYTYIGVDELPQFPTPDIWNDLRGALRSVDPEIPEYMRACVDEGDVLTQDGWKPIQEVRRGELVYSLNIKTNTLELKPVTNTYRYDVDEELTRFRGKGFYMSTTKDHRVVHATDRGRSIKIDRLNEITNERINFVRTGIHYNSSTYRGDTLGLPVEVYMYLLGLFLSEGCTTTRTRVVISQTKEPHKTTIREFLSKTNKNWKEDKFGFALHGDYEWHSHFSKFGKAVDKFIPRDILTTASKQELEYLLDALILGDGHRSKFDYIEYYTISKQLWDDVAELALKCGYKTYQTSRIRSKLSKLPQYSLSIRKNLSFYTEMNTQFNRSFESYKGPVWCISVWENENFVLRQKGVIAISGNTGNP